MITVSSLASNAGGRFGNTLFQFCTARALANKFNCELVVPSTWIGLQIFDVPATISDSLPELPRTKLDDLPTTDSCDLFGYWQFQDALDLYSLSDVLSWLQFKPSLIKSWKRPYKEYVAVHQRLGDYYHHHKLYAIPNTLSYYKAIENLQLQLCTKILWVSDGLDGSNEINWVSDFLTLAYSNILIRANSTFSWWAGVLGKQDKKILAPLVEDRVGICDVEFVDGNWPQCASQKIHGTRLTDLYLKE